MNHISNNTDVVDGDVELKEGEMTLEEEIFPPTYHSPKFSKGEEGDLGELSPFQAMIDLPTSSDNWASPVAKDAPPTTIKIVIDNTKSLFRPRRLTFQYAFFSKKIRDTAVGAAGDMRQRELEEKTKQYQQLKESGALGMKILGGLVVGGVVTGGGIGALAGGMVVVGGWKAVEKIKEGIDKAGDEADFEQEEKAREDAVREGKMKELEERLSEQTKLQQLEKGDWEEQRNMLLSSLSNLKLQLLHSESSCSELRKNLDSERLKSDQRERELIVSVVELEGHVRKLKRDKKVLVVEVRKLQSENERVKVEMEAELEQAKMNYRAAKAEVRKRSGGGDEGGEREREGEEGEIRAKLRTLKLKREQLIGVKAKQQGNVQGNVGLDGLIRDIEKAILDLERRMGGGSGGDLNFIS